MDSGPKRRVKVVVNGKPYVVEVGDLTASPATITVNGQPYLVAIEPPDAEATPTQPPAVAVDGGARETSAPQKAPAPLSPAGPAVRDVRAPMPGNIVDISVRPGDRVKFGQQLCSLEAMKMKSAIRSPRDGVVARVDVAEGDAVAYGDVLITFG